VAIIYRHVEILMAHGFSAFVHMREQAEIDFYHTTAQLLIGNTVLNTSDVLVIPETFDWALKQFRSLPLRRLMFCQNHNFLPPVANPRDALTEWGVHGVIASSLAIQTHLQSRHGLSDVPLVPCAVDPIRFAPVKQKKRQVAFMPRKLRADTKKIYAKFRKRYRRFADVPWVLIDQMSQAETAAILNESSVFLALGSKESLGLPPLEAMASGCLVAGYHGDGGREYISNLNGWWAETGDWKACVDGLAAALDLLDRGGHELTVRRSAMAQTVAQYSPQRMETALLDFWRAELVK
jgi:glycosyltransferase involved in cell wall biosynthesis